MACLAAQRLNTPPIVRPFLDMPLVAGANCLDCLAVVGDGGRRDWTWREIHAASIVLADSLESEKALCNLCHSRSGFLVTWLAALRRGCVQLLPPSGGQAELVAMLTASGDCQVVVDDADTVRQPWAAQAHCLTQNPTAEGVGVDSRGVYGVFAESLGAGAGGPSAGCQDLVRAAD